MPLMRPRHYQDVPDFDPGKISSLWVSDYPSPQDDLRYAVTVCADMGDDPDAKLRPDAGDLLLCTLRGYQPMRYAAAVMNAWARAKYEQCIWAQMQELKLPLNIAAPTVLEWRKRLEPLNPAHTAPLVFEPITSGTRDALVGVVSVSLDGHQIAAWDLDDAHQHAMQVLEVAAMVACDQAYYEQISGVGLEHLGIDAPDEDHQMAARAAVAHLGEHFGTPATKDGWAADEPGQAAPAPGK